MPIFFQQQLYGTVGLAVWKIEEEAEFFLDQGIPPGPATHPVKALQHLAGRYLLRYLYPDFPLELIRIADSRKPYLEDAAYDFSVSHWGPYAGVLVGQQHHVGMDLEGVGEKVHRIRSKFVSPEDEGVLEPQGLDGPSSAALVWSAKEALFKWYGLGGVDFRRDLRLQSIYTEGDGYTSVYMLTLKNFSGMLQVNSRFTGPLCISYTSSITR